MPDRPALSDKEIEITPEMIEAGARILRCELGGAVISHWSPAELAKRVAWAMFHPDDE